ncbi:hypothetical protein QJS10_CPB19g02011 [Acorus calamus]|uniref:Uncharacterized protein n=1 Tax=Acorus calamus TaxID=4465 RepID=A0AAV9CGX3_ACOCL|nr:hypothetical protein QJS10_CPB19g02011 [Acorus calamus]
MGFIDSYWLHSYYAASTTSISSSSSSLFLHGHMNNKMDVKDPIDLTMMASKIAYEDPAYIQNTVEKQWNVYTLLFPCSLLFLQLRSTQ